MLQKCFKYASETGMDCERGSAVEWPAEVAIMWKPDEVGWGWSHGTILYLLRVIFFLIVIFSGASDKSSPLLFVGGLIGMTVATGFLALIGRTTHTN